MIKNEKNAPYDSPLGAMGWTKHTTKQPSKAAAEVFGEELREDNIEKHRGTKEERTLKLHHSMGNIYAKSDPAIAPSSIPFKDKCSDNR